MDHSYFKDRISGYYDNNLPPYEQQSVEEHLKTCEECQKMLAQFEKLDKLVEEKSVLSDTEYWEKSAQKIENAIGTNDTDKVIDVSRKSFKGLFWKISAIAASVAALFFITIYQGDITQEAERQLFESPDVKFEKKMDIDSRKIVAEKTEEPVDTEKDESVPQQIDAKPKKEKTVQKIDIDTVVKNYEIGKGVIEKQPSAITKAPRPMAVQSQIEDIQIEDESKIESHPIQLEKTIAQSELAPVTVKGSVESVQQFFVDELASADKDSKDNLEYLRRQKDSLSEIYTSYAQTVNRKLKASRSKSVSETDTLNDSLKSVVEKSLLEAYYKIGLNSDSELEKLEAIRFFENYISRKESFHNDLAQKYLVELK